MNELWANLLLVLSTFQAIYALLLQSLQSLFRSKSELLGRSHHRFSEGCREVAKEGAHSLVISCR